MKILNIQQKIRLEITMTFDFFLIVSHFAILIVNADKMIQICYYDLIKNNSYFNF
jgi:hypothetical protein